MFAAKLAHFQAALAAEVEAHRRSALGALAAELRASEDAATGIAQAAANDMLAQARRTEEEAANRTVAQAEQEGRTAYENERARLHAEIREDAARMLAEFAASDEYDSYLSSRIQAAKLICGEHFTKVVPAAGGGFTLMTDDEKTRKDYSFKRLLHEI